MTEGRRPLLRKTRELASPTLPLRSTLLHLLYSSRLRRLPATMGDTKPETHAFFGHEIASERKAMFKVCSVFLDLVLVTY